MLIDRTSFGELDQYSIYSRQQSSQVASYNTNIQNGQKFQQRVTETLHLSNEYINLRNLNESLGKIEGSDVPIQNARDIAYESRDSLYDQIDKRIDNAYVLKDEMHELGSELFSAIKSTIRYKTILSAHSLLGDYRMAKENLGPDLEERFSETVSSIAYETPPIIDDSLNDSPNLLEKYISMFSDESSNILSGFRELESEATDQFFDIVDEIAGDDALLKSFLNLSERYLEEGETDYFKEYLSFFDEHAVTSMDTEMQRTTDVILKIIDDGEAGSFEEADSFLEAVDSLMSQPGILEEGVVRFIDDYEHYREEGILSSDQLGKFREITSSYTEELGNLANRSSPMFFDALEKVTEYDGYIDKFFTATEELADVNIRRLTNLFDEVIGVEDEQGLEELLTRAIEKPEEFGEIQPPEDSGPGVSVPAPETSFSLPEGSFDLGSRSFITPEGAFDLGGSYGTPERSFDLGESYGTPERSFDLGSISFGTPEVSFDLGEYAGDIPGVSFDTPWYSADTDTVMHSTLDVLGYVPKIGTAAGLLQGTIYGLQGEYKQAAITYTGALSPVGVGEMLSVYA